jgi:phosphatidylglycerophosphatase C
MSRATAVFDLDKVLLAGDASTLFLRGLLARAPARSAPLLAAAPLLLPGSAVPGTRPLAARAMTRLAVGGRDGSDVDGVAAAFGRRPELVTWR